MPQIPLIIEVKVPMSRTVHTVERGGKRLQRVVHEQTSPTASSPGLSQSMSNSVSNSSSSPPEPKTPPRTNQSRTRYGDLGRVPLHRRGTSKTYERLEDLLKEAGYKETRIFTPEAERVEANADHDPVAEVDANRLSIVKDGVGAVVGFLAGLMPSVTGSRTNLSVVEPESYTTSPQEYSPPPSPLTQRPRRSFDTSEPPTPTVTSLGSFGDPTPRASRLQQSSRQSASNTVYAPASSSRTSSQLSHAPQRVHKQPSRTSLASNNIASPRPSRATVYLRHMASTPSIPQRPNSTPVHATNRPRLTLTESDAESETRLNEDEDKPPLPSSWLETVARAVLFGGTGAHIGGPSSSPADSTKLASASSLQHPTLRSTRSSLSQAPSYRTRRPLTARSGLSDQTNITTANSRVSSSTLLVPPPPLFSKIERGRAGRSEGEVSMTRVVCRSAPGSRTGSLVRGASQENRNRKERGRAGRRKRDERDRVPSLARTHAEGDVWSNRRKPSSSGRNGGSRHLSAWGADVESDEDDDELGFAGGGAPTGMSSEEDEGELDLARILVPPKRQNSIKSLRKHLASDGASSSGAHATLRSFAGGIIGAGPSGTAAIPRRLSSGRTTTSTSQPTNLLQRRTAAEDESNLDRGDVQEEWGGGWVRRNRGTRNRNSDDEDVESFHGFFGEGREDLMGSGRSRTGKSRLGINSAWGLIGGGGGGS